MKTLFNILLIILTTQAFTAEQYLYLSNKSSTTVDQYSINPKNGVLELRNKIDLRANTGPLTLSEDQQYILTSAGSSKLLALSIGTKGKLSIKSSSEIPMAGYGVLSKNGKYFLQYHYRPNKVSVLELNDYKFTGTRTEFITTTKNPHDIIFSNDKKLVFVPHNWENKMYQYAFDNNTGKLTPLDPPFILGPNIEKTTYANFRSMAKHPKLNIIYCTYEKGGGLASLKYDHTGLKIWQEFNSTREGQTAAASRVTISPNNRFLFMSNRKKGAISTLAVFELSLKTGEIIKRVGIYDNAASMSREVEVDKSGKFLYSSSKALGSTFLFHINDDGSLKQYKEFKIGGGPMLILNK